MSEDVKNAEKARMGEERVEVCPFDETTMFSPRIREMLLAQPLNPIRKLEFRPLGMMER